MTGGVVAYALVVKQSKVLAEGRRFEIPRGANLVIGRSQHLAGIVVKDELVRLTAGRSTRVTQASHELFFGL